MEGSVIEFSEDVREVVIIYGKDLKRELFYYENNGDMDIPGKSRRNSTNL